MSSGIESGLSIAMTSIRDLVSGLITDRVMFQTVASVLAYCGVVLFLKSSDQTFDA